MTNEEIKALIKAEQALWIELHEELHEERHEKHFVGLSDISMVVLKGHLVVERLLTFSAIPSVPFVR